MDLKQVINKQSEIEGKIENINEINRKGKESDKTYRNRLLKVKAILIYEKTSDTTGKVINTLTTLTTISLGFITFVIPCLSAIFSSFGSRKEFSTEEFSKLFSSFEKLINAAMNAYLILVIVLGIFIAGLLIWSSRINKRNKNIDYIIQKIDIILENLKR